MTILHEGKRIKVGGRSFWLHHESLAKDWLESSKAIVAMTAQVVKCTISSFNEVAPVIRKFAAIMPELEDRQEKDGSTITDVSEEVGDD